MSNEMSGSSVRERLILAGIREIENSGVQNFSMRRVASECGVSCTAPYKHFADKNAFLTAIIEYVYERWDEQRDRIAAQCTESTREKLTKISMGFIRFLNENPHFRSIIMLRDLNSEQPMMLRLTDGSRELVGQFCREVGMPSDVQRRKLFLVRSIIYGAALMMDSGELSNDESDFRMVESLISREFEIE